MMHGCCEQQGSVGSDGTHLSWVGNQGELVGQCDGKAEWARGHHGEGRGGCCC
jgi:hypothetical protein